MLDLLRPTHVLSGIEELPWRRDITEKIKLIALDADGTIANYHELPDAAARRTLVELGDSGINLCIISNAYGERVEELKTKIGDQLDMPVFAPMSVTPRGGDPTANRKPSPAMLIHAAKMHGVKQEEVLMVGDQIFKDVLSANRAGAKSLLVPRRGEGDHIGVKILQRPVEAMVRRALGIRFDYD